MKVKIIDKKLWKSYANIVSILSMLAGTYLYFWEIPQDRKTHIGIIFLFLLFTIFIYKLYKANSLEKISLEIDGTTVEIKKGNLFEEDDNSLIAISFNEYFDTLVDNVLIAKRTINGQFIEKNIKNVNTFDSFLDNELKNERYHLDKTRKAGKDKKYDLGTTIIYNDKYLLTAFTKFDQDNRAVLTIDEYITFLMHFWKKVDKLYALRTVVIPIFGSGITRIEENNPISDEDLLRIILWTFKLSPMRFNDAKSKLVIVIHENNMGNINLFNIKGIKNGI